MPALNFKKEFAPFVEAGLEDHTHFQAKRQTIRARRKDGRDPKEGQQLFLYTGMRTQVCRKLGEAECKSVQQFTIEENLAIYVGTHCLTVGEEEEMAKRDGFKNRGEFLDFFRKTHGLPFHGFLIKW